ncbi:MAG: TetR/AcrR family transcriptional regulator [Clostridiales bacterium]|nr:TetR/AcrR family transcriptional regulator [Clostridiales bacterium]
MQKTKRQIQKEQTRKKIIEAAYKVYSENGFTAASAAIAKEAGVSHGLLFLHFPTLDELLACLSAEFAHSICEEFKELAGTEGSIEDLLGAHVDILSAHEGFYARMVAEAALLPKGAANALANVQACFAAYFNAVLDREIKNGVLKRLPAGILLHTWIGLLHYYLLNKDALAPGGSVLSRYKKQLIFTYCELIRRQ